MIFVSIISCIFPIWNCLTTLFTQIRIFNRSLIKTINRINILSFSSRCSQKDKCFIFLVTKKWLMCSSKTNKSMEIRNFWKSLSKDFVNCKFDEYLFWIYEKIRCITYRWSCWIDNNFSFINLICWCFGDII